MNQRTRPCTVARTTQKLAEFFSFSLHTILTLIAFDDEIFRNHDFPLIGPKFRFALDVREMMSVVHGSDDVLHSSQF